MKLFWVGVSGSDVEEDQLKWRNKYLKYKADSKLVAELNLQLTSAKMNLRVSVDLYTKTKKENKELQRSLDIPACTPTPTHKTMAEDDDNQVDYEADSETN